MHRMGCTTHCKSHSRASRISTSLRVKVSVADPIYETNTTICSDFVGPVVPVRFLMSSIPLLVDEPLERKSPDQPVDLVVEIAKKDLSRFIDCLKHRRVVCPTRNFRDPRLLSDIIPQRMERLRVTNDPQDLDLVSP